MGTKEELRKEFKIKLSQLEQSVHLDLSHRVSRNLKTLLNDLGVIQQKMVTGVFAPIQQEPKWYLDMGDGFSDYTAYPVYSEAVMGFKLAKMKELKKSFDFGVEILGPDLFCPEVIPQVIVVPGLGFTKKGERLGRGKGFYDQYLEKSNAIKIGIAFEIQIVNELPTESHDVKMDFVVTDKFIYRKKIKELLI